MVAVSGATGYTGALLGRRLIAEGEAVRCLVRPGTDASPLEKLGVEVVRGDLERTEGVAGLFAGVRVVLHLASIRHVRPVLAGVDKQVERLVLVSSLRRFSLVCVWVSSPCRFIPHQDTMCRRPCSACLL